MTFWQRILATQAPAVVLLIRLMVGGVFVSEGTQKFLFPESRGVGRFTKIGIVQPEFTAPMVGVFEIGCGSLVLVGLVTRVASVPLAVIMLVAIATTKIPILSDEGFWAMAHAARTDFSMLLGSFFLIAVGAGQCSMDAALTRSHER